MKKLLLLLGLTGVLLNAQEKKVGINTDAPQSTLHINGDMNIRKLGNYVNDSKPISWNPSTLNFSEGKPDNNIKVFTFYMKTSNQNKGQVFGDLDTGISTDKYVILITDWQFSNANGSNTNYYPNVGIAHVKYSLNTLNPLPIVDAYKHSDGKWHIRATYACASNEDATEYGPSYWSIETMILPRGFADHIEVTSKVTEDPNNGHKPTGELSENPLKNFNVIDVDTNIVNLNYETSEGNVGINTNTPEATLDVNGKVALKDLGTPSENAIFLSTNSSGEIIPTLVNEKKPIYQVSFFTPTDLGATDNNDRDRVKFFDTRIPTDKFYILINRTTFVQSNSDLPRVGITHETTGGENYNPSKLAILTDTDANGNKSDTWGFRLDYINAGPSHKFQKENNRTAPQWEIETLIISKKFMEDIAEQNMQGTHSKEYIIDSEGNATNENFNGLPEVN